MLGNTMHCWKSAIFRTLTTLVSTCFFITVTGLAEQRRFKIGISVALTGPAATYGEDTKNVILYSLSRIAGAPIDLVIEDDRCSPKDAAAIAHKLVNIDKVDAVLGPVCTGAVLAAAPIYERSKVLHISPNARSTTLTERTPWTLVANPGNERPVRDLLKYIKTLTDSIAVFTEVTDYCKDLEENISKFAKEFSISLSSYDFQSEKSDLRTDLQKILYTNPPALFLNVQTEASLLNALKIVSELKYQGVILTVYYPGGTSFLAQAGSDAEGIIYSDFRNPLENPGSKISEIFADFVKRYGAPNSNASNFEYTFDLVPAILGAFKSGGTFRDHLLSTTQGFPGVQQTWRFTSRRRLDGVVVVNKIRNSRPEIISQSEG